jgi:HD-GYP domain-containing protein (c-di-GMP phosphodiesterase class II)
MRNAPLTDGEWASMRRHPTFAYEFLAPITYLHPSIDIPHCHHEKWDGSGYPRGLKGEEIPQSARIFAVIDVWDALTSDRPSSCLAKGDGPQPDSRRSRPPF